MKRNSILPISIALLFLTSCSTGKIVGLWTVESVHVGTEEMTPSARWMQFHKDMSQQSGNGWRQHSVGTWNFDKKKKELSTVNTNGYDDPNPPFRVSIKNGIMEWDRIEKGQPVTVTLKRTNQLPVFHGDKLLGIWDLKAATEDSKDVTPFLDPINNRFLFFRWDNIYSDHNTPEGRLTGTYKVHGHKPEVEMMSYGEKCAREWWTFEVSQEHLVLRLVNSEKSIVRKYQRIYQFPE